jgi:hypothetical protein
MWMMCMASTFFIITGSLCFYVKDLVWDLLAILMRKFGFEPERTRVWNVLITLYGIFALVIGFIAVYQVFKEL